MDKEQLLKQVFGLLQDVLYELASFVDDDDAVLIEFQRQYYKLQKELFDND